ncbi:glycosyltransferase family 4 protein [Photobacterium sp. ZSDE20]|uniref:Glycosyltransferase family 4 protein n=1 Tax=Photobacterium pectinilyticum TaxID=2906793 RepID=A0ABT1N7F9_9GAMM|nr:glycosyltransferase family 4 protein [Photobacterium sp. ZSDE20]MCQ1060027.1 glycosyltransferase family 4 protein [Photobacterium sp. ZSDE20]MDD1826950.1 glycosyltransferase family 4 protein [Photobacterium sp. ZSDE20]
MTKVLIVTSELISSGPNNVIKSLVKGLSKKNIETYLTSLRIGGDSKFIKSLSLPIERVFSQEGNISLIHLFMILRKVRPDIVNSHGIRSDLFLLLLAPFFNLKVVSTIHNVPNEDYLFRYGKIVGTLMLFIHSLVFKSKRIHKVAVSQHVKNNLIRLGGVNISVVYNGVIIDDFSIKKADLSDTLCKQYGFRKNSTKVIFCGHLTPLKDPLIVANSANSFPNFDFIFLGSGPLSHDLTNIGDNVFPIGRVNNVSDFLSISDVYVMPSHTEGMPMALIEAMLMDLPVLSSDIPIFIELSKIRNIQLVNFKVKNTNDFCSNLNKISTNYNCGNRDIAMQYFSADAMAVNYLKVFENVC